VFPPPAIEASGSELHCCRGRTPHQVAQSALISTYSAPSSPRQGNFVAALDRSNPTRSHQTRGLWMTSGRPRPTFRARGRRLGAGRRAHRAMLCLARWALAWARSCFSVELVVLVDVALRRGGLNAGSSPPAGTACAVAAGRPVQFPAYTAAGRVSARCSVRGWLRFEGVRHLLYQDKPFRSCEGGPFSLSWRFPRRAKEGQAPHNRLMPSARQRQTPRPRSLHHARLAAGNRPS
jgi:hypothetical protein